MLIRQHHRRKGAPPDIERAPLVAEPWPAPSGTNDPASCIAPERRGSSAAEQQDSFPQSKCSFKCDFQVRRHPNLGIRIAALKKNRRAANHVASARAPQPSADSQNTLCANFLPAEDHIRRLAQREPRLRVPRTHWIRRARHRSRENFSVRIRQDAVRLRPAAVETEEISFALRRFVFGHPFHLA